jgi:hypothetical protein
VKRRQLIELEDQAWFPRTIRDLATDYLQFVQTRLRFDRAMTPLIRRLMETSRTTRIVDLCSGGSGPLLLLVKDLAVDGVPVTVTMTDLYPNIPAFAAIATQSGGRIGYEQSPVDARAVPPELAGLRTLFNAFHHLTPADARSVLHAAAAARQPIAIFEISERSWRALIPIALLTPLFVWLATPFMRPFLWRRLLWTYPIPLVPFTCWWDGIVSQLRAYSVEELRALGEDLAPMRWEAGQIPVVGGGGRLTYLLGFPT